MVLRQAILRYLVIVVLVLTRMPITGGARTALECFRSQSQLQDGVQVQHHLSHGMFCFSRQEAQASCTWRGRERWQTAPEDHIEKKITHDEEWQRCCAYVQGSQGSSSMGKLCSRQHNVIVLKTNFLGANSGY